MGCVATPKTVNYKSQLPEARRNASFWVWRVCVLCTCGDVRGGVQLNHSSQTRVPTVLVGSIVAATAASFVAPSSHSVP